MEMILKEIEAALAAKLYYLAVTLSLTLPDVCAALEAADGGTSSDRYKAWYTAHLGPTYGAMLTADDCCSLRILHRADPTCSRSRWLLPLSRHCALRMVCLLRAKSGH